MTASTPRDSAQAERAGMVSGARSPRFHEPMREDHSLAVICSRSRSDSRAMARSDVAIWAHKSRTGTALRSITNVICPSDDCRVNSIDAKGPSVNHSFRTRSVRGSQISEPQPRQAMIIGIAFCSAGFSVRGIKAILSSYVVVGRTPPNRRRPRASMMPMAELTSSRLTRTLRPATAPGSFALWRYSSSITPILCARRWRF